MHWSFMRVKPSNRGYAKMRIRYLLSRRSPIQLKLMCRISCIGPRLYGPRGTYELHIIVRTEIGFKHMACCGIDTEMETIEHVNDNICQYSITGLITCGKSQHTAHVHTCSPRRLTLPFFRSSSAISSLLTGYILHNRSMGK